MDQKTVVVVVDVVVVVVVVDVVVDVDIRTCAEDFIWLLVCHQLFTIRFRICLSMYVTRFVKINLMLLRLIIILITIHIIFHHSSCSCAASASALLLSIAFLSSGIDITFCKKSRLAVDLRRVVVELWYCCHQHHQYHTPAASPPNPFKRQGHCYTHLRGEHVVRV